MTTHSKRANTTSMTLNERFQKALKREREAAGVTQVGLAVASDFSVSMISMLERGQRSPPLATVEALASALGVDPLSLLR